MNATAKTILALAAIAGTVFGITVIAQYTRKPEPKDKGGNTADAIAEIVRYDMGQMRLDPDGSYLAQRTFPGIFEVGTNVEVLFWVHNDNPFPVSVSTRGRSCKSCTNAWIAVFDKPAELDGTLAPGAALLGGAAYASPDRFNSEAWQRMAGALPGDRWQSLNFDKPEARIAIPAATDAGPVWVAVKVKLDIKAGPHFDKNAITANLAFHAEGAKNSQETSFAVEYAGVPPFDIFPKELKFGDLAESVEHKTSDVFYFSATQANLPPPLLAADRKDPFLTFGQPHLLNAAELKEFIAGQGGMKMLAAYRVPVTLSRKTSQPTTDTRELDIGPLEKSFTVTASAGSGASHSAQVQVKATVRGVVSLDGGAAAIDLGDFNGRNGTMKEATLVGEKLNVELESLTDSHQPAFLQVTLGAPRNEGGRRYWTITVRIEPPNGLGNLPPDSAVVLRVKSTGQIVRIPVKGHGRNR